MKDKNPTSRHSQTDAKQSRARQQAGCVGELNPLPHGRGSDCIDWSELQRRLKSAQATLGPEWEPTPDVKKRILRARAETLAREPQRKAASEEYLETVEFLLAYEKYAVESSYVREVCPLRELTPLPGTPPFVLGIVNIRGQILSVVDMKKFFDLPEKGLTDLNKIIIVGTDEMELGLLADVILGVRSIPVQDIQPSLPTLTGIRAEYLRGVTKERLVILDGKRILSDRNIVVHQQLEA